MASNNQWRTIPPYRKLHSIVPTHPLLPTQTHPASHYSYMTWTVALLQPCQHRWTTPKSYHIAIHYTINHRTPIPLHIQNSSRSHCLPRTPPFRHQPQRPIATKTDSNIHHTHSKHHRNTHLLLPTPSLRDQACAQRCTNVSQHGTNLPTTSTNTSVRTRDTAQTHRKSQVTHHIIPF